MPKIKKEITSNPLFYSLIGILLIAAFVIRIYRVNEVLGFYFDQGRDALVVWDLLKSHKFFLIGPTTGIAGIFRGPFFYYLITPFYFLGNGNPIVPANFLALTSVVAMGVGAYLMNKITGRVGSIIFLILSGFSFYIVLASRWLSNPTPMLLLSMLLLYGMFLVQDGKKWAWVLISFVAGSSLFHFGSSGEFFYFPAIALFFVWQIGVFRKRLVLPPVFVLIISALAFFLTAAPLLLFDLRHERILTNNILEFLFHKGSFKSNFISVLSERLNFYYSVFGSKIFETRNTREIILLGIPSLVFIFKLPTLLKNKYVKTLLLLFASPLIGLLFFQGNEGNIYDYYLTGYYLVFLLVFSMILSIFSKKMIGKIFLAIFFSVFLTTNIDITLSRLNDGGDGENTIIFVNQRKAMDWIKEDSKGESFNTDYYVPPVIPYSYTYLERWYHDSLSMSGLTSNETALLYTLYEQDPPHPERLTAWMDRQKGIGKVIVEKRFGGITVQRRLRISK